MVKRHLTEEHKRKMVQTRMKNGSYKCSETTKNKMKGRIPWNKGKHNSKQHIKRMVETRMKNGSYIPSDDARKKMSDALKGNKYNLGHHPSLETLKKMRECCKGEKSYNWQGGKSFEKYTLDWTKTLREAIRQRDNYTCQLCLNHQYLFKRLLHIHHIDYDKKNCNPNNLISLCTSCHGKTNHNQEYWIKYFNKKEVNK